MEEGSARALVALDEIGEGRFRSRFAQPNYVGNIFGGQPLCHALAAAQRTVAGWPVHSLAGQFLRGGAIGVPIDYEVETVRDGRRYAARRVRAIQEGRAIFDALCSFHDPEEGFAHQAVATGDPPAPETLVNVPDFVRANAHRLPPAMADVQSRPFPVEVRLFDPERAFFGTGDEPVRDYWLRIPSARDITSAQDHACLLAFLSDYWLAGTAGVVHRSAAEVRGRMAVASLNHSMWFHGAARVDEWLLYRTESPWSGAGRGLIRGFLLDRAGRLVASTAQEASLRLG